MNAIKYFEDYPNNWDAIVNLMDDDIREEIHIKYAPCERAFFLMAYCDKHFDKYGKEFYIN